MANYQDTVRLKMRDLSSSNPATRRAAAYYLGEAGVDESITRLVTLYKSDPDPSVRKAAAYALGMFKAVDEALKRGEEEQVVRLLKRVVDENKLGQRLGIRPAVLARIMGILALLLVLQLVLHFVLPGLGPLPGGFEMPSLNLALNEGEPAPQTGPLTEQIQLTYVRVTNDLTTLQAQFQAVLTGGTPNCTAFFNLPDPITIPDGTAANVRALAESINSAQAVVMQSKARLDGACYEEQPINASEVGGLLGPVVAAQRTMQELESQLSTLGQPTATPEPSATPTEAVTATPAPPTETPEPTDIPATATPEMVVGTRQHLTALYGMIDSVTGPRNAAGLLRQVWTDTANAGTTRACREPVPPIPADYVLSPQDAAAVPELAQAVEQVNLGMTLLRQGWDLFANACASNSLFQQASVGLQTVGTAEDAFRVADGLLQAVRSGL
jgi:hypothetical protein